MDLSNLLSLISQYGWSSIFIAAAIGIIYIAVKLIIKHISTDLNAGIDKIASELTTNLATQNDHIVDVITTQNDKLIDYITKRDDNKVITHATMLEERMVYAEEINDKLKDIRVTLGACHVMIFEFHNSYQNLSGTPFAKYSCTYESFALGKTPLCSKVSGYPFSIISSVVKDILSSDSRQVIYNTKEEILKSPLIYDMDSRNETKALIYNAMFDNNNNMIGVLTIVFDKEIDDKLNLEELKIETAQITSILNLRYKYTK